MRINICILLLIAFVIIGKSSKAQNSLFINPTKFGSRMNNGIPLTKTEFDEKVVKYLKMMMEGSKFNTEDYIDMARIYNTLGWPIEPLGERYRLFYDAFLVVYTRPAAKKIDAGISKGMSYYSSKYNLYIGDGPIIKNGIRGSDNSKFKVDTLR